MNYGHAKHVPSPDDLTVLYCRCGWRSDEMTETQLGELGVPWYCGNCDGSGSAIFFIKFHPDERSEAYRAANIDPPKRPTQYSIICTDCFTRRPGDVDVCPGCGKDSSVGQGLKYQRALAESFTRAKYGPDAKLSD